MSDEEPERAVVSPCEEEQVAAASSGGAIQQAWLGIATSLDLHRRHK